jgi:hypothetical protein
MLDAVRQIIDEIASPPSDWFGGRVYFERHLSKAEEFERSDKP